MRSSNHRFILAPYTGSSSRITCPACGAKKSFAPYIDTETGEILGENAGRCNRESKCSYHYTPSDLFSDQPQVKEKYKDDSPVNGHNGYRTAQIRRENVKPTYIAKDTFTKTLSNYDKNNFYTFLVDKFGKGIADKKVAEYHIGTSKKWSKESTVFWQVDNTGNVRTGKIMLYNPDTGKRVKGEYSYIAWVHTTLNLTGFNLSQCLFGLHLSTERKDAKIAVVESEKTAVISSIYYPDYIWMATGAKFNLKPELFEPLKGRDVVLFPDLGCYGEWCIKADSLKRYCAISIDKTLNSIATPEEYNEGLDIADYLLRTDYKQMKLKESFINDLMQVSEDNPQEQVKLFKAYVSKGLQPDQAKQAINILTNQYNFITDTNKGYAQTA